jgi:hypothetical protein
MTELEKAIHEHLPVAQLEPIASDPAEYRKAFIASGEAKGEAALRTLRGLNVNFEKCGYFSVGGSFGSEIIWVLEKSAIRHGVLLEYDPAVVEKVIEEVNRLKTIGKCLTFIPGDATQQIDACRRQLDEWRRVGLIDTLVCSAQAILHELPSRSPGFHLAEFLSKVLSDWPRAIFICREPCAPTGWPSRVELSIPQLPPKLLAALAQVVKRDLRFNGAIRLVGSFVEMPAALAVETLVKAFYPRNLGHELGECITGIKPSTLALELESQLGRSTVTRQYLNSEGFERNYRRLDVHAHHPKSKAPLLMPITFCRLVADSARSRPAPTIVDGNEPSVVPGGLAAANSHLGRSPSPRKARTYRFLRRRCRVIVSGSKEFLTVMQALLSRKYQQKKAEEMFKSTWSSLSEPYERVMSQAAYLETAGQIEEMLAVLGKPRFEASQESSRLLFQAIGHEKLDKVRRAQQVLRTILASEPRYDILRAAQFNLHVCFEKLHDFWNADFSRFISDKDLVFIDGERMCDKAIAMQLILCLEKGSPFLYGEELTESLEFLVNNSNAGYAKTLLTSIAYHQKEVTPQVIDSILPQLGMMDLNSRVAVLVTLHKYLPEERNDLRGHVAKLIRKESTHRSRATAKWKRTRL